MNKDVILVKEQDELTPEEMYIVKDWLPQVSNTEAETTTGILHSETVQGVKTSGRTIGSGEPRPKGKGSNRDLSPSARTI